MINDSLKFKVLSLKQRMETDFIESNASVPRIIQLVTIASKMCKIEEQ
jgi:hypothetical protein